MAYSACKKEKHLLPPKIKQVHFIGIGGYGMSALALILLKKGYFVSGSDIRASALTTLLAKEGAAVTIGHNAANLGSADLVVYSTAVPGGNPEFAAAEKRNLTIWHRSELLAALLNNSYGIAIAGAHGKTTTTAMVALLLEAGGLDPTAVIGGVLPAFGSNARLGSGRYLVAEADESDSSFTRYHPRLALVTGIEPDHLEHYENDYSRLQQAYSIFLSNLPPDGTAVLCSDDRDLTELGSRLSCKVVYYSGSEEVNPAGAASPNPAYYPANIGLAGNSSVFDLYDHSRLIASAVTIGVPGRHNIGNAVGALALASQLGLDPAACAPALAAFQGVGRRFEVIGTVNEITVIDDYAHHPTEVRATIETARLSGRRVICLFQPHRYSRTAAFFGEFARAFDGADLVLLHSIYPAGEPAIPGITSEALAEQINRHSGITVTCSDDITILEEKAAAAAYPGDLIITMGAGDVTYSAPRILKLLEAK
jgi:UDP-N-acetylmuramate--alanine ligase